MKLFVYGTKKKGFWNHRLLEGSKGTHAVARNVRIYNPYAMPLLVQEEGSQAKGELYEVDEKLVEHLDRLEGCPRFFHRLECTVRAEGEHEDSLAWAYFYQGSNLYPPCPNDEWGSAFKRYFNPNRDFINELAEAL